MTRHTRLCALLDRNLTLLFIVLDLQRSHINFKTEALMYVHMYIYRLLIVSELFDSRFCFLYECFCTFIPFLSESHHAKTGMSHER